MSCDHSGIGEPGCYVCDPDQGRIIVALRADVARLTLERDEARHDAWEELLGEWQGALDAAGVDIDDLPHTWDPVSDPWGTRAGRLVVALVNERDEARDALKFANEAQAGWAAKSREAELALAVEVERCALLGESSKTALAQVAVLREALEWCEEWLDIERRAATKVTPFDGAETLAKARAALASTATAAAEHDRKVRIEAWEAAAQWLDETTVRLDLAPGWSKAAEELLAFADGAVRARK